MLPVFGILLYSWTGLFIGLIIGLILDMYFIRKERPESSTEVNNSLQSMMLTIYMMQATRLIREKPFDFAVQQLSNIYGSEYIMQRRRFIQELTRQKIQVDAICRKLQQYVAYNVRRDILQNSAQASSYAGMSIENFQKAASYLGMRLAVSPNDIEAVIRNNSILADPLKPYFDILGISHVSSQAETKKAYLSLVKKYHPDTNTELPHAEKIIMSDKFRKTKEAYTAICAAKHWK